MRATKRIVMDSWTIGIGLSFLVTFAYLVWFVQDEQHRERIAAAYSLPWLVTAPTAVHLGVMVLNIITMVAALVFLYMRSDVPQQKRELWFIAIVWASIAVYPIFWWRHVFHRGAVLKPRP